MASMDDDAGLPSIPAVILRRFAAAALDEDLGRGDVTTDLTVPQGSTAAATVVARDQGVLAGLELARTVFQLRDPSLSLEARSYDGARVRAGDVLLSLHGDARSILTAERVALNYLGRLSGIATLTSRYVDAVAGTGARIVDTRKTTPGLRVLEKYAVRCGGGYNHRFALDDGFLLKDNHRAAMRAAGVALADAVTEARRRLSHTVVLEVEVDSLDQLDEALAAGVDAVLLDNMDADTLRRAMARVDGRARTEASGGITLDTARAVAETGVELISVGALTHSAPALDVALDWKGEG